MYIKKIKNIALAAVPDQYLFIAYTNKQLVIATADGIKIEEISLASAKCNAPKIAIQSAVTPAATTIPIKTIFKIFRRLESSGSVDGTSVKRLKNLEKSLNARILAAF